MSGADFGMGKGKIYPASAARQLLNPLRRLVQPPARTVRHMRLAPHHRVLELGCGPGWFSPTMAASVPKGSVTLCDMQQEMLDLALKRTSDFRNVTAVPADATRLPFGDGSFDAVLVATMLGEVPDPSACLREVRRVLAPGGSVTVSETRRDSDFIPLSDLLEIARGAGLHMVERHGPRLQYVARFVQAD